MTNTGTASAARTPPAITASGPVRRGATCGRLRAGRAPRARLAVWPSLSTDIDAVLRTLPVDGLIEGVRQDDDGTITITITSAIAEDDEFPETATRMSRAHAAALLPVYAGERRPLYTAVMPHNDVFLRARW
ncbi:hypothetical protein [Streptomyces sp. NPDC005004]